MRRHDAFDHGQTFVRLQTRDGCNTPLRLVQEVGGGTECAAHRAIIERDQPHRANFSKMRFARGLARQRPNAIRRLQALPVGRIRHLVVGCAVDRIAKLAPIQGTLRYGKDIAVLAPRCRSGDAACRLTCAQTRHQLQQRPFAFAENDQVEWAELKHQTRTKGCFHAARNNQRFGPHPAYDVRKFQIESQRHPRGRDTHDVPWTAEELALERALRRLATAVRIEDLGLDSGRFEYPRKPPDTQRRSEEGIFTAMRIVGPDEQNPEWTWSHSEGLVHGDFTYPYVFLLIRKCALRGKKSSGKHLNGRRN